MRLSLKESRMKLLNATNLDRKSGIRGPKMMGEARQRSVFSSRENQCRPQHPGLKIETWATHSVWRLLFDSGQPYVPVSK
jgi:hypothetical protein